MALGCIYVAVMCVGWEGATGGPSPSEESSPLAEYLLQVFGLDAEEFWQAVGLLVRTQEGSAATGAGLEPSERYPCDDI